MNIRRFILYLSVICIGIGFIIMALENVLGSAAASVLQGFCGTAFIAASIARLLRECRDMMK